MKNRNKNFLASLGNALKGLYFLFSEERNAKIHAIATIIVIAAGFYYNINSFEWLMIGLAIVTVLFAEAINTVIENIMDFISEEHHPKIGKIKDISSGAVLLTALFALFIAFLVFWDKVF